MMTKIDISQIIVWVKRSFNWFIGWLCNPLFAVFNHIKGRTYFKMVTSVGNGKIQLCFQTFLGQ